MHSTCPAVHILRGLITVILFGEEYRLWDSLHDYLHPSAAFPLTLQNILLKTSFFSTSIHVQALEWGTNFIVKNIVLPRSMYDYKRGLDRWVDLLTTYTHDSILQAIIAPSLISTQSSVLSLSLDVSWQQLQKWLFLSLRLKSSVQKSLSTHYASNLPVIISRHGPHRKHTSSIVACVYAVGVT
jgi:hypothetical protein